MDERTGVMMSASLMIIVATLGTDEDVKQAARGYAGLIELHEKYGRQAVEFADILTAITKEDFFKRIRGVL